MNLYNLIKEKKAKISVIGLGYVGMPIAVAFSRRVNVIGFDINAKKIDMYRRGIDPTKEVGNYIVANCSVDFTSEPDRLNEAKFHIIAVPTPVNSDHTPDLIPVISASKTLGKFLTKGSIVVYESTVYPGVTEEICIPILEQESNLKCGIDFKVGYSPERINPGDKEHRLETIVKIVSGIDKESLEIIAQTYRLVVDAGVYSAPSIRVAEAAKVIENSQRDINIAFMNELAIIFNKMGIDTGEVLKAARTKWNFLNFYPGLVGGHCIGVDPYYLTYKAEQLGYHSQIILSGRRINDGMSKYLAEQTVKLLIKSENSIKNSKVGIFGVTFKENCPDVRNTKVIDLIRELEDYGIYTQIIDPIADIDELKREYCREVVPLDKVNGLDAAVFCVAHEEFLELDIQYLNSIFSTNIKPILDVRGILERHKFDSDFLYWKM